MDNCLHLVDWEATAEGTAVQSENQKNINREFENSESVNTWNGISDTHMCELM